MRERLDASAAGRGRGGGGRRGSVSSAHTRGDAADDERLQVALALLAAMAAADRSLPRPGSDARGGPCSRCCSSK
jgi:hypothetical protein